MDYTTSQSSEKLLNKPNTFSESMKSNQRNGINTIERENSFVDVNNSDNFYGKVYMLKYFDPESGSDKKILVKTVKN